jgi:hypothetical protein
MVVIANLNYHLLVNLDILLLMFNSDRVIYTYSFKLKTYDHHRIDRIIYIKHYSIQITYYR